ncbi:MAG: mannose-1-phosphate guanylyltransferase/mannose-6-phosphate isomerase [Alphaproteobacteria bacterium]
MLHTPSSRVEEKSSVRESPGGSQIVPVILCGGSGTRLWPASRSHFPKQLLPMTHTHSLLQRTALRVAAGREYAPAFAAPILVCNERHRFLVQSQLEESGTPPRALILEPDGRNTAPAIGAAAHYIRRELGQDTLMLVLPADHHIADENAFRNAIAGAAALAGDGYLVTFGVTPEAPATGYGYIEGGEPIAGVDGARRIARFVEKPDADTAREFLASGRYVWNAGIFLFRADAVCRELERHCPAIHEAACASAGGAADGGAFLHLDPESFCAAPSISIDYAVMEHTEKGAVIPVSMGWSDIGSWEAVWEWREKDAQGNVKVGDALTLDTQNTLIDSRDRLVATLGVEDLVVVDTADACLIAHRSRSEDVKSLVAELKSAGRHEVERHRRETRPWGGFQIVHRGERFQVKEIVVTPGERLSLQLHHHRTEHWTVVSGTARVFIDGREQLLKEGEAVHIPAGTAHRIENPGRIPLVLIEVQAGAYLGEDDIVRLEDKYDRHDEQRKDK